MSLCTDVLLIFPTLVICNTSLLNICCWWWPPKENIGQKLISNALWTVFVRLFRLNSFYWTIDLKYVNFCYTAEWCSYMHIYSFSYSFPLWVITEYWMWFPGLISWTLLLIHPRGNSEYSLQGLMLKLKLQYFGTWFKELTHWKRPWCWKRLRTWREVSDRGWDGFMALPTQWTWVWANSGRLWKTRKPDVLQSLGLQRDMT